MVGFNHIFLNTHQSHNVDNIKQPKYSWLVFASDIRVNTGCGCRNTLRRRWMDPRLTWKPVDGRDLRWSLGELNFTCVKLVRDRKHFPDFPPPKGSESLGKVNPSDSMWATCTCWRPDLAQIGTRRAGEILKYYNLARPAFRGG